MRGHGYQTTRRSLDYDSPPMRLWQKAKRLGIWNPQDIDFTQDRLDWQRLDDAERDILLRLTSLFQAGEEAVTIDLLPLIATVAEEGRLEEEMYLTSFLWEEAKHVEAFRRFLDHVVEPGESLDHFQSPAYRRMFGEELPAALGRLRTERSPQAQAVASVTYNLVVEGVLAETGYHAYYETLRRNQILPGMQRLVDHLKLDESRHLAFGVYFLSRLVVEHGSAILAVIDQRLGELLPLALGSVDELFAAYDPVPFNLGPADFHQYALTQFEHRRQRILRAGQQSMAELRAETEWELAPA
jgi:ribonucleoside-diphosphate reductase beta chain